LMMKLKYIRIGALE